MNVAASRGPSIRDVAGWAGVSHQTVSRVINNHSGVHPDTRAKVLEVIAQVGYRPNIAARRLVTNNSATIGVISVGLMYYGASATVVGVSDAALEVGLFTSVVNVSTPDHQSLRRAVEHLLDQGVEGILIIAPQAAALEALMGVTFTVPFLLLESSARGNEHSLALDSELGAKMATEHLLELGHRKILHLSGPPDWFGANVRISGWRKAMEEADLETMPVMEGDWTPSSGYVVGQKIAETRRATAVFAGNDQMALGLIRGIVEAGLRVPEDISVVGYDDLPDSAYFSPPLTTVRLDYIEVGRQAVKVLSNKIKDPGSPVVADGIELQLIVRKSTGPVVS